MEKEEEDDQEDVFSLLYFDGNLWQFSLLSLNACINFDIVTLTCILEKRYLESESIYCQVKETVLTKG